MHNVCSNEQSSCSDKVTCSIYRFVFNKKQANCENNSILKKAKQGKAMQSTKMSFASLQWHYRISELSDIFSDITPVNIMDDDHFEIPITTSTSDNDNDTTNYQDKQQTIYAVTSIDYSEAYRIAYGYFRAILRINEMSNRTLKLSATCLQLHPANYTVWHYRRQCLTTLYHHQQFSQESSKNTIDDDEDNDDDEYNDPLESRSSKTNNSTIDWSYVRNDLDIALFLGGNNPKNYQIWYHRRAILEQVPIHNILIDIINTIEIQYINSVLNVDAKNYHAWSHRQWIISILVPSIITSSQQEQYYDDESNNVMVVNDTLTTLWENELIYTEDRINDDIRNNSAWNYRWYIIHHRNSYRANTINTISSTNTNTNTNTNSNDINTILVQTPSFNIYDTTLTSFVANMEIDYAIQIATIDPYNESPWKYLIAILREQQQQQREQQHQREQSQGHDRFDHDEDSIYSILQNVQQQIEIIERDCLLPYKRNKSSTTTITTTTSTIAANDDNPTSSCNETSEEDGTNKNNDAGDNTATAAAATSTTDCDLDHHQHHQHQREQLYCHRIPSIYLLSTLIDIWMMIGDTKSFDNAKQCIESFMILYDPIRTKYWQYRLNQIIHKQQQQQ